MTKKSMVKTSMNWNYPRNKKGEIREGRVFEWGITLVNTPRDFLIYTKYLKVSEGKQIIQFDFWGNNFLAPGFFFDAIRGDQGP